MKISLDLPLGHYETVPVLVTFILHITKCKQKQQKEGCLRAHNLTSYRTS